VRTNTEEWRDSFGTIAQTSAVAPGTAINCAAGPWRVCHVTSRSDTIETRATGAHVPNARVPHARQVAQKLPTTPTTGSAITVRASVHVLV
jgi:hypothetical protein